MTKIVARRPWSPKVLLKLGRVSNLPTVWTNALAGTVISAGEVQGWRTAIVIIAMSSAYIGGMYLNDYFDRDVDSVERPSRPIPAGEISVTTVGLVGFGMLGMAVALLAWTGILSTLVGALLAVVIVFYDRFHKNQPLAPAVMGLCRALVYCNAAAAAVDSVSTGVAAAALAMLAYVAGITYAARQESLDHVGSLWPLFFLVAPLAVALPAWWQGIPAALLYVTLAAVTGYAIYLLSVRPRPGAVSYAVGILIAGISLVDGALLAAAGAVMLAVVGVAGFMATLLLQRYIPGT